MDKADTTAVSYTHLDVYKRQPILYASWDGTGTPMRKDQLEGCLGRQPDGSACTREAKLGSIFTQSSCDEDGEPLRDPDSTTYVGTFEGCRSVAILLREEALRRGLGRAQQVVCLGDGAAWVWEDVYKRQRRR